MSCKTNMHCQIIHQMLLRKSKYLKIHRCERERSPQMILEMVVERSMSFPVVKFQVSVNHGLKNLKSLQTSLARIMVVEHIEINEEKININHKIVDFDHPVAEIVEFEDFVAVRLQLTGEGFPDEYQNVIGVNSDGSIRWKIEKAPEEDYYDSYSGIHEEDNKLYAYNLCGILYEVNKETGRISEGRFVR